MNRLKTISILLLVNSLFTGQTVWAQTHSPQSVPAFADWLFSQGEFSRAAGEYYRYLFTAPTGEHAEVLRKIGACYVQSREYRKALLVFEKLIDARPAGPLAEEACYEAAYCSFKLGEYDASTAQIKRRADLGPLPAGFLLLDGANRLLAGDWEAGGRLCRRYLNAPGATSPDQVSKLLDLVEEAGSLPSRNAWTAGIFSALLPGAGKSYAGRWEDGLVSLLLCGFLGGMAAYSFWSEGTGSVKAWIYTALGGIFYLGDIWGSAAAADQFNASQKTDFQLRLKASVELILQ